MVDQSASTSSHSVAADILAAAIGASPVLHTTEVSTLPAAGHRIVSGPLLGLFAWRFVVRLDRLSAVPGFYDRSMGNTLAPTGAITTPSSSSPPLRRILPDAVVVNFVLDTGTGGPSIAPADALAALGYKGSLKPGSPITLVVQGLKASFVVGAQGEAGRLTGDWLMQGLLAVFFDWSLNAPVMYVADEPHLPKPSSVPRTVVLKHKIRELIWDLIPQRNSASASSLLSPPPPSPKRRPLSWGSVRSHSKEKDVSEDNKKLKGMYGSEPDFVPPPPAYSPETPPETPTRLIPS